MSVQEYFAELQKGMIRCGIEEDLEDKVCHFYDGLRHEIHDIVDYKDFNTTNKLFQLAMCNTPGVWLPHLHLHFINMSIIHPFMSLEFV